MDSGDARSAKADAKAAKARAKALRPWYKKKRFILGGILLLIVIAGVASGGGDDDDSVASGGNSGKDTGSKVDTASGNTKNPPENDVTITACGTDDIGWLEATVDVVNNSSKKSSYFIEVTFESEDGSEQFETALATVNNLEPGQKKTEDAVTLSEAPEGQAFKCRITDVNRFAS